MVFLHHVPPYLVGKIRRWGWGRILTRCHLLVIPVFYYRGIPIDCQKSQDGGHNYPIKARCLFRNAFRALDNIVGLQLCSCALLGPYYHCCRCPQCRCGRQRTRWRLFYRIQNPNGLVVELFFCVTNKIASFTDKAGCAANILSFLLCPGTCCLRWLLQSVPE